MRRSRPVLLAALMALLPNLAPAAGSDIPAEAAIGRLNPGNGAYCTAVLIAPKLAATASHCLYNRRTNAWVKPDSLHFLLGYRGGEYRHHARVARYVVAPNYDPLSPSKNLGAGWALLVLTEAAPADTPPLVVETAGFGSERTTEVKGYSMQRKYAQSTSAPCRMRMVTDVLLGECRADRGMSGAPLLDTTSGRVVGIQIAGGRSGGRDVMIAVPAARLSEASANVGRP